jgi:hypothetical protein
LLEVQALRFTRSHDFSLTGWIGTQKLGMLKVLPLLLSNLVNYVETGVETEEQRTRRSDQDSFIALVTGIGKSFYCMISLFFLEVTSAKSCFVLRETVKVLLYRFGELEKANGVSLAKRKLATTGNHLAMLRAVHIVYRFGSLRSFYDIIDEIAVQKIKQRLDNTKMSDPNWLRTILENCTAEKLLSLLVAMNEFATGQQVPTTLAIPTIADDTATLVVGEPFWCLFDVTANKFFWIQRMGGQRSDSVLATPLSVDYEMEIVDGPYHYYFITKAGIREQEVVVLADLKENGKYKTVMFLPMAPQSPFNMVTDYRDSKIMKSRTFSVPSLFG